MKISVGPLGRHVQGAMPGGDGVGVPWAGAARAAAVTPDPDLACSLGVGFRVAEPRRDVGLAGQTYGWEQPVKFLKTNLVIFLAVGGLLLVALAVLFLRKPAKPARPERRRVPRPAPMSREGHPAPGALQPPTPPGASGLPRQTPAALAAFQMVRAESLDAARREALAAQLRRIPRPPPALQKFLSRDFMTTATSAELSALVMSEPQMAAKVLATVNSPLYGVKSPVSSIGQAVTFLGFNTVRSIGLQYMRNESFKAGSPELNQRFAGIWASSALASELCARLAKKLDLPDQGALATQMVLSFIGQLATCSLLPVESALATAKLGFLERAQLEQAQLTLASAAVGGLLMQEWGLPPSIIESVQDIDLVLVTPAESVDASHVAQLGLSFLCARLGERLARGALPDLSTFDLGAEEDLDLFHLRSYLSAPALARLPEYLRAPDLGIAVAQMQRSLAARH
jgi:HD-like signal output (HDOD) protein